MQLNNIENENIDESIIKIFNEKSNLPVNLLSQDMRELENFDNVKGLQNIMSYDFISDDFKVIYSGYPTDEETFKMTDVCFFTDKYNFLGIHLGEFQDKAINKLLENGFELSKNKDLNYVNYTTSDHVLIYNKKNCKVAISFDNNIVNLLEVSLISKYLGNRLY